MKKIKELEARLAQFKNSISPLDWESASLLRDEAIERENDDLELAYLIMKRANVLRPHGPFIVKKLHQYKLELQTDQAYVFEVSLADPKESAADVDKTALSYRVNALTGKLPTWAQNQFFAFVVLPWFIFCIYLVVFASPRYESQSKLIVRQPDNMATMDASMAILSGLGVSTASTDTQLVESYIHSMDMLEYLAQELDLKGHYSNSDIDFFSRLSGWNTREDYLQFYIDKVDIEIDEISSVITVRTQAFSEGFAKQLNSIIVKRAEWFINNISHQIAKEQLAFVQGEHQVVADRMEQAKATLLAFQSQYNLLDPEMEGAAYQEIAYTMESQISAKKAELYSLQEIMSENSPQVISLKRVIAALETQLEQENKRLSGQDSQSPSLNVGEKLARYSDYKIELELTMQAYASSLISLEKARIEAYRQLLFLVVVETPTLPEDNKYPKILYNLTLFAVILLMLFGVYRIVAATINELN
ncbi:lipopolysaccharide biosynthesis protein [Thalassotalea sp. Y01]|uniref:lipopolysaccharide biosynthesis protein n=1 Tax=Thalassotalea sp. Y01 TaxID=2729613 RepID=UPI00145E29BA|nr:lipopolysaccharide biosynthesis protein [Thalassotalea sp. Y01]NMP14786.1 lipopolysaccharide biosynthesis protein [Thalassotalea sp. Y01]